MRKIFAILLFVVCIWLALAQNHTETVEMETDYDYYGCSYIDEEEWISESSLGSEDDDHLGFAPDFEHPLED
jgi:hypothetical protein